MKKLVKFLIGLFLVLVIVVGAYLFSTMDSTNGLNEYGYETEFFLTATTSLENLYSDILNERIPDDVLNTYQTNEKTNLQLIVSSVDIKEIIPIDEEYSILRMTDIYDDFQCEMIVQNEGNKLLLGESTIVYEFLKVTDEMWGKFNNNKNELTSDKLELIKNTSINGKQIPIAIITTGYDKAIVPEMVKWFIKANNKKSAS